MVSARSHKSAPWHPWRRWRHNFSTSTAPEKGLVSILNRDGSDNASGRKLADKAGKSRGAGGV